MSDNVSVPSCPCDICFKRFTLPLSLLYMLICSLSVVFVLMYCVCLCAYHWFFSSDLNKAWPGGNCPSLPCLFIPFSPSLLHVKHTTLPVSNVQMNFVALHPKVLWDTTMTSLLLSYKAIPVLILERHDKEDNIGKLLFIAFRRQTYSC